MSSPEYERVTDNDLLDAMNPLRRQRKRTKEETIYGMWAESASDEEEGSSRAGFGLGGKRSGKADYSRPVSFVSGGLKKTGEEMKEEMAAEQEKEVSTESEKLKLRPKEPKFSMTRRGGGSAGHVADWERHTKGIGSNLLSKMGWKAGEGLGKNKQGIAKPVEAYVRKGKGALGFYGSERTEPVAPVAKEPKSSSKPAVQSSGALPQQLGQWKKAPGEKKKVQYVVRSTADIAANGDYRTSRSGRSQAMNSAITSVKVIDLTGKDKVVYSGYSAISRHHMTPDSERIMDDSTFDSSKPSYFDVPELRHNIKLLVNAAEEDVIDNLKQRDREADQIACLGHDKLRLDEVIADEERSIAQLQKIVTLVSGIDSITDLNEAVMLLNRLESEFEAEYRLYGLDRLLLPMSEPLLRNAMAKWNALEDPTMCLDSLCRLRQAFVHAEEFSASGVGESQFGNLLWETWVPPVRQAIISRWNPREPESLVMLLEKWQPILPDWIWQNICDQFLVPKLLAEAENWNPITDTLPIHSWIHPWLSLLSEKLEVVYLPIRQKIGAALTSWYPSDPSARILLSSWVRVWSEGHMRSFLLQHIGPKLTKVMQDLVVNPRQQQLEPWKWVFDWIDFLPHPFFVTLLERHFFPKWLAALAAWLDSNSCDYQEVTNWYIGWKNTIPPAFTNEPIVKDNLGKALAMMNHAIAGGRAEHLLIAGATSNYSGAPVAPPSSMVYQHAPYPPPPLQQPSQVSFKELIERRAEVSGLLFMPLNRRDQQQQMYQLGRAVLYIDRNVVFVSNAGTWTAVSLDELFSMA